ncbi:hypothetical protein ON010_g4805 [Phytophthora cinnamomi]|nr:hypothetical protein ON010_g4805 [Phytophthora cinnamomi]
MFATPKPVIELGDDNFDDFLQLHQSRLVHQFGGTVITQIWTQRMVLRQEHKDKQKFKRFIDRLSGKATNTATQPQPFTSAACTRSQLTPYLQAGDIGIYKTFKDLLYMEINAWKESDKVEYTRFGNPRMPAVAVVCEWVRKAWRDTDSNTVINSVSAAGFADSYLDWHVAKHDVYGEQFCTSWEAADEDHEDMDDFNLDELHDALDDAALIDEDGM